MNIPATKLIAAGLLLLFTLLSGLWVSHSGKPINTVIFTIHKLIALATVIVTSVTVYNLYRAVDARTFVELVAIAVTGLLFLTLFITGALLSPGISGALLNRGNPLPGTILRLHQAAPLLVLASSTLTTYLLVSSKP